MSQYEKQRRQKERLSAKTEKRPEGNFSASGDSDQAWNLLPQSFELRDWQVKALENWKSSGQRGTVKVATGAGKTLFALAAVNRVQNNHPDLYVVIVVPTIPLMYQWQDELRRGSVVPNEIGLMGGGHTPDVGNRILIAVLASAREKLKEFVSIWNCEGRLFLVVDECHRTSADQSRKALDINPTWALGLSATPSVCAWMRLVTRSYQASTGPRASSTNRSPSATARCSSWATAAASG